MNDIENPSSSGIFLPLDDKSFRDFVSSLLGQKQIVNKIVYGTFEISRESIVDIKSLIEQRISLQNQWSLISEKYQIFYQDNSSITLNSINDFNSFSEIKKTITIGINFSISFLIAFPGRDAPEKQTINIYFDTDAALLRTRHRIESDRTYQVFSELNHNGKIEIEIEHTNRSWGVDIENICYSSVNNYIIELTGLKRLLTKNSGKIGFLFGLSVFSLLFLLLLDKSNNYLNSFNNKFEKIKSEESTNAIDKIDLILEVIIASPVDKFAFFVVASFFVSLFFGITSGIFTGSFCNFTKNSSITFTKEDEIKNAEYQKKYNSGPKHLIIGIAISISASLCAAFIFDYFIL